nr:integrase, catalytic region, zinc finger, CCHC-type, peptidase aspartic, catalytic [Tanacetum cinerariifolium]
MANLSEDIQCVGLDTRPHMLDRTDFASMQQRIRLYYRGKDNGVNILKSIDEGPIKLGTFRETLAESTEGTPQFGPKRSRVYSDLKSKKKDRYNADIRATNILLQGLPKDIYTLINTLTQKTFGIIQHKEESIHDYYVRFAKLINDMRNIKMTMSKLQLNSKFVNNMLPEWGRFVTVVKLNRGLRDSNYDQLLAYLKQHEAYAKENKMMLERLSQPTVDPLALLSNVSNTQHGSPSSSTSSITPLPPPRANSSSPADDLIENLTSTLALLTQSYITFLPQTNNQLRTSSNARNQATIQNGRVVVQNGQARPGQARTVKCYNYNGTGYITRNCTQPKRPQNSEYFKDKMLLMQAQENRVALDVEQLLFLAAKDCDAFDSDVDEAPTAQTMFMANLSSANPITDKAGPSYDLDILSEVKDHDQYLDDTYAYQEEHVMHDNVQLDHIVDLHADYTSDSNMIPYDQYVEDNEVPVVHSNASSVQNDTFMMIYNDMCEPSAPSVSNSSRNAVIKNSLTAELATYREQVELYERRAKFELTEREQKINEQLRLAQPALYNGHEILKDNHAPAKVHNTEDTLEIAKITRKKMNAKMTDPECVTHKVKIAPHDYSKENLLATFTPQKQLTPEQIYWSNDLMKLKSEALKERTKVSRPIKAFTVAENDKVKQHYKQLYDSIKITRTKHIEQVTKLTAKNMTLKTSVSKAKVQPLVLTRTKHAVDVEPIVPCLRNNKDAHLNYLRHLKESVETIRDIVEEAKVVRPLDRSIVSACRYTKHSQELLEYAIGTCPQGSQQRAKQLAYTPLIRKKQSNPKTNRISPAKGANKLPVEDFPKTNKSHLRTTKRVDSSSRIKRTVINSNSDSICQTCNKCLASFDHDMCVAVYVKSVVIPHSTRHNCKVERKIKQVWKPKQVRKVWKPTGKVLTTIGHQWRPTCRILHLGKQCPLTRFTPPQVVTTAQNKKQANTCANQKEPNHNWGSRVSNSPSLSGFKCRTVRFENDHFGAIMGYGDYVVGESVISRVYYVEGLGHNLFSVGQFCDSDLESPFRKHSCYVQDTNGVDLINGSHGSNLYTILVEDMMKSSPICLLSKASKNKSWLWHRLPRTPQQNGVVKRQNRTLIEAARTMLIFSKASMFLWAEVVATAEDLKKLQPTADTKIFVGYAPSKKGYRIYNKRTRRIMETIHVQFDELTEQMAPVHLSTGPAPNFLTPGQISSGLPMFDEYLEPPRAKRSGSPAQAVQAPVTSAGTPLSTTIDQDAPSLHILPSSSALQSHSLPPGVVAEPHFMEDHNVAPVDNNPFVNVFAPEPHSEASSSGDISSTESPYVSQSLHHLNK